MTADKQKSSVALMIIIVVVILGGIGVAAWYGYSLYQKKEKEKSEQIVVKLRKEKLAKEVKDLLDEARKLYDENKHAEALEKLSEAMKKDPTDETAKKWHAEMSQAIELGKILPVKKLAEEKWVQANALAPGQGFTEALKAIEDIRAEAEKLFEAREYQKAGSKFNEVVVGSEKLQALDLLRQQARKQRDEADAAFEAGDKAKVGEWAKDLWAAAQARGREALSAFEKASFEEAGEAWKAATVKYAEAVVFANGTRAVNAVEGDYRKELAAVKPGLLDAFGGSLWASTKSAADSAMALARDTKWADAVARWGEATALLRQAMKSAEYEETKDRMQKQYQTVMTQAAKQLQIARAASKNDSRNALFRKQLDDEIVNLDMCRKAEAYGMLTADDHGKLDEMIRILKIEKFHFRFADLAWSSEPASADPAAMGEGSAAAFEHQARTAVLMDIAVQTESRKAGIVLRLVPDGSFVMGGTSKEYNRRDEMPPHTVAISKPFYMSAFEITQGQWKKAGMANNSHFRESGDSLPVENVTWEEAVDFCRRLCGMEDVPRGTYRLPTEAEWEYACRAGTSGGFCSGETYDDLDRAGWYGGNSDRAPHAVGRKMPNAYGVYDMHGNVWEWCADGIRDYKPAEVKDPVGAAGTWTAIARGGGWKDDANTCRSANRGWARRQKEKAYDLGFRVVRVLQQGEKIDSSAAKSGNGDPAPMPGLQK